MHWNDEAEKAMARVPFFVRKRVKKRVEEEAARQGASEVTLAHVTACQQRFMTNQEAEVKGYQVEGCFGSGGCPNRIETGVALATAIEEHLASLDLKGFLKAREKGPLKMHHEFRVTLAECPNSCSRPQIVDIGLIAASRPEISEEPCSGCGACVEACKEGAITLAASATAPTIDLALCLACGQCSRVCPTGTIKDAEKGYRILLGGKLGRHPQLGRELPALFPAEATLAVVKKCLGHFMARSKQGERFGELINRTGLDFLERP